MKEITSVEEAKKLLLEIQNKIDLNGLSFMKDREKNRHSLGKLGIMVGQVKEIIKELRATDYCAGPDPDEKYPWKSVSVFGTRFRGVEIYVKLSVGVDDTPVVCLSFHEAERPMTYQFK